MLVVRWSKGARLEWQHVETWKALAMEHWEYES